MPKPEIESSRRSPDRSSASGDLAVGTGTAAGIRPADVSLLDVCTTCHGKCCVGRTMAGREERERIVAHSGADHFVRWADDLYFLNRGPCPYLKDGLCSVQDVKPFVCQIFPFVPRVVDGELWLFCVGECDAGPKLPQGFVDKARRLAQAFFAEQCLDRYAEYWNENKVGDFDDSRAVFKIRVYDQPKDTSPQ